MSRRNPKERIEITRRTLLTTAAVGIGTAMTKAKVVAGSPAHDSPAEAAGHERRLVSEVGERSPFEQRERLVRRVAPSTLPRAKAQSFWNCARQPASRTCGRMRTDGMK